MHQPDFFETPEWAIQCFEKLTGLQLVVHDIGAHLWPFLQPERFKHRAPCCIAVKATHDWACMDFEVTRLRPDILHHPEGRCHVCHAGFMEWVMPVFIHDQLAAILFAGQALPKGNHAHLVRDIRRSTGHVPPAMRSVREEEADPVLESLRQLRSRLLQWHEEAISVLKIEDNKRNPAEKTVATRRQQIQHFIYEHHTNPAPIKRLARYLHLGESRTIHLVKELFGCSYIKLVNQMRLRTAASLLRNSSLPILEISLSSGFKDLSYFHRTFRKHFGSTPLQYRHLSGV